MTNLSQWFQLSEQKPWEVGVYIVYETNNAPWYSYWNGKKFGYLVRDVDKAENHSKFPTNFIFSEWRGLSTNPEVKKKENKRKTMYVVMKAISNSPVASFSNVNDARDYAGIVNFPVRIRRIRFRT